MVNPGMVMYEEEFTQIQTVVDRLVREANAKVVFIVDKNGQLIAASGEVDNIDTTSLASLTAGNIAATGGIAAGLDDHVAEAQGASCGRDGDDPVDARQVQVPRHDPVGDPRDAVLGFRAAGELDRADGFEDGVERAAEGAGLLAGAGVGLLLSRRGA